ncbi:MAG: acyl-CoA thioesterase [Gemmata sp.]|jgi:acyl-CoA thioester hydrolase
MPHPLLAAFPVVIEFDIGWSDMDSFDHVSNLEYFRYFQDARLNYILRTGWLDTKRELGLGPILKTTTATYRKPLKFPDHVWVGARAVEVQPDRVVFEQHLVSRTWDAVACEGSSVVVSYDYQNACKAPLPDCVRRAIGEMEARPE